MPIAAPSAFLSAGQALLGGLDQGVQQGQQQAAAAAAARQAMAISLAKQQGIDAYHQGQVQNGADRNTNTAGNDASLANYRIDQLITALSNGYGKGNINPADVQAAQSAFGQPAQPQAGPPPPQSPSALTPPTQPVLGQSGVPSSLLAGTTPAAPALTPSPVLQPPTVPASTAPTQIAPGVFTTGSSRITGAPPMSPLLGPAAAAKIQGERDTQSYLMNTKTPYTQAQTTLLGDKDAAQQISNTYQPTILSNRGTLLGDQAQMTALQTKELPGVTASQIALRAAQGHALGETAGANAYRAKVYGQVAPIQANAAMTNAQAHAATVPILQENATTAKGRLGVAQAGLSLRQTSKATGLTPGQAQKIINDNNNAKVAIIKRATDPKTGIQRPLSAGEQDLINRADYNIHQAQGAGLAPMPVTRVQPLAGGKSAPNPYLNMSPSQLRAVAARRGYK